jgi:Amt family ammonium transporter
MGSIAIGFAAGIVCCLAVGLKNKFKFDDALDVVGVHLVGGVLGALLIGLFATKMTNGAGANGVFYKGGWTLMGHQAVAVAAVVAYSFVATYILAQIMDKTIGLRVNEEAEATGLDLSQHGETAYDTTSYSDGSRSLSAISSAR